MSNRWSRKYDFCILCKTAHSKHQSKGRCKRCYDNLSRMQGIGELSSRIAQIKFGVRKRVVFWLQTTKKKKTGPKTNYSLEQLKEKRKKTAKKHYEKNKGIRKLLDKTYRRRKKDLPCMQIIVNSKTRYFPFETIPEKPSVNDMNTTEYLEWKRIETEFELLRNYYNKIG